MRNKGYKSNGGLQGAHGGSQTKLRRSKSSRRAEERRSVRERAGGVGVGEGAGGSGGVEVLGGEGFRRVSIHEYKS